LIALAQQVTHQQCAVGRRADIAVTIHVQQRDNCREVSRYLSRIDSLCVAHFDISDQFKTAHSKQVSSQNQAVARSSDLRAIRDC